MATKSNRRWLSPLISYLCVAGFIYGVGLFVGYLTEHKIAYLGLKMVVFFTIVGVMWGLMVWSANRVCLRLSQKLVQKGIVLSAFINKLLAYGIVLLIGFVIRLLIEKNTDIRIYFLMICSTHLKPATDCKDELQFSPTAKK
ncbi:hypothetical protein [Moraxella oblonga]|uniref:hypothetical protein n=1 Tax=Moraxella oblonga TaxID=200413 RepID=UPI00146FCC4C|nr:hypothetical protein [Moraxella oblonga]